MELGSTVRFSSHPRPFLVKDVYCDNPDCDCNDVQLFFTEISDRGEHLPDPIRFAVRANLDTWQECDAPSRPAEVAGWVREFLATCPADRRAEFKAQYEDGRRTSKWLAEYTIDPDDILEGQLVSFADILAQLKATTNVAAADSRPTAAGCRSHDTAGCHSHEDDETLTEEDAASNGGHGFTFTYQFVHEEHEYLIKDLYCPNPKCRCDEVHAEFWECSSESDDGQQRRAIRQRFLAKVTLDGRLDVRERYQCKLDVANRALRAWWDTHRDDIDLLRRRYETVKEIGQRSLDAAGLGDSLLDEPLFDEPLLDEPVATDPLSDEPPSEDARVGRNDPCPCGSGKKFKKCCWRKENREGSPLGFAQK